jgi:hypothetical protein
LAHHFLAYIISIHSIQRQHVYRRPQAAGSPGESQNEPLFHPNLVRLSAFMAVISSYLFAAVPKFTYPLISREFDVGISDGLSNYGRCNGRLRLPGAHSQIWTDNFY